ncbi:putative NAC domain protein [Quillaja saponaria]|uniref:NAC domain protein n=1 Tax=Quillaja saponaria TaxID=32244 RepID=A0AAD7QAE0_QUISA|nr:putative NAC domain protein [Quillaja saponaria]
MAMDDESYWMPPGFRFKPTDEELIIHYLNLKVKNQFIRGPHPILDVDIYKFSPQELSDRYKIEGEKDLYFFTPRNRKYLKGTRPDRMTESGYWKATAADKNIRFHGSLVGKKKPLVFFQGNHKKSIKTNWLMQEFTLEQNNNRNVAATEDMRLDEYVLCKVYNNGKTVNTRQNPPAQTEEAVAPNEEVQNSRMLSQPNLHSHPYTGNRVATPTYESSPVGLSAPSLPQNPEFGALDLPIPGLDLSANAAYGFHNYASNEVAAARCGLGMSAYGNGTAASRSFGFPAPSLPQIEMGTFDLTKNNSKVLDSHPVWAMHQNSETLPHDFAEMGTSKLPNNSEIFQSDQDWVMLPNQESHQGLAMNQNSETLSYNCERDDSYIFIDSFESFDSDSIWEILEAEELNQTESSIPSNGNAPQIEPQNSEEQL